MVGNCGNITPDRAGGTSSINDASGKPPAVYFEIDNTYKPILDRLSEEGFVDAGSGEAGYLIERASRYHLEPYLNAAKAYYGDQPPQIKTAYSFMVFDRKCQALAFEYIGVFETQTRAQYSHWMELEGGMFALYDSTLFIDEDKYLESREHMDEEIERRAGRDKKFRESMLDGMAPVNSAVECMTLGTLSQLYANTKRSDNLENVAQSFNQPKVVLINWMKTICAARNCCAHFDCYFFKKQIPSSPKKVLESNLSRKTPMYLFVILEKLLSSPLQFGDPLLHYSSNLAIGIVAEIDRLVQSYPSSIVQLGLDEDWKSHLSCPEVIDASITTVMVNEETKQLSIGRISEEPNPRSGFHRAGMVVSPRNEAGD